MRRVALLLLVGCGGQVVGGAAASAGLTLPADSGSIGAPVCPCTDVTALGVPDVSGGHVELYAHNQANGSLWRVWDSSTTTYSTTNAQKVLSQSSSGISAVIFGGGVQLYTISVGQVVQLKGPSWSSTQLGAPSGILLRAPLAFADQAANGNLELFAIGSDGAIWHRTWTTTWSAWASLGTPGTGAIGTAAAALQIDGKMALFMRDGAGTLWYALQAGPGGAFGAFRSLGGIIASSPSAAVDLSGKISLYAVGSDGGIWTDSQTTVARAAQLAPSPIPWTGWASLVPVRPGGEQFGPPVATVEDDGAVHFNFIDYQPATFKHPGYNLIETIQYREGDWLGNGSDLLIDAGGRIADAALASAREPDGRIVVFRLDSGGNVLFKRPARPQVVMGATTWVGTVEGGLNVFRGIPYAAQVAPGPSPLPILRWKPPIAPSPPSGMVNVYAFGHACWSGDGTAKPGVVFGEDCLNLNIYAPAGASQLPVVVFLHGGGNFNYAQMFTLEPLARNAGVVVVTVDFRIGAFGMLGLHALTQENGSSSNFTLMDQAAALKWVHANIGAFGGDPNRIVALGTSSGSHYLEALLASPLLPAGTLAGAMLDSGVFATPATPQSALPAVTLAQSEQSGVTIANLLSCSGDTLTCLRKADPAALAAAYNTALNNASISVMPTVDGVTLASDPPSWLRTHATVPLVIGGTKNEAGVSLNVENDPMFSANDFYGDVEGYMCGSPSPCPDAQAVENIYTFGTGGAWPDALHADVQFETDYQVTCPVRTLALDVKAAPGASPVYRYLFTHVLENDQIESDKGAYHSATNAFFFGSTAIVNNHDPYVATPAENTLSDDMITYVMSFATSGNPNSVWEPAWPAFTSGSETALVLDEQITTTNDYLQSTCTTLGW